MSTPRKVLYVSPVGERGGAETTLLNLLTFIDRVRFSPRAVVLKDGPLVAAIEALGVPTTVVPVRRLRAAADTWRAVAHLRRIIRAEAMDLVFGNMAMGHVYGGLARLGTRARAVWFQHGIADHPDLVDRLAAWLPASEVFAYSSTAAEAQGRIDRTPVRVVGGGVDPRLFEAMPRRDGGLRAELGVDPDARLVACIARLQRWKGQSLFLTAMANVLADDPMVHALVVGGTLFGLEEDYPSRLRAEAASMRGAERVHFLGQRADVAALLSEIELLVHCPLEPEPFGLVVVEAMMSAVPVVATRSGGPAEIVVDGQTGLLVRPGDARALTGAIQRVLHDASLRKAMGAAGRERAVLEFTAEAMTSRVEQGFATVLAD